VIVVDDGSTDTTPEVVRDFPSVRYLRQANAGCGPARNTGVHAASGDLLAFLDHDDLWAPEKLALQVGLLRDDATADAALGRVQNFISPELAPEEKARIACPPSPMPGYAPSALLVRREAFARVGDWPASAREGVEWFVRAKELGLRFVEVPQVVTLRRLHRSNSTRTTAADNQEYARILHGLLARRRARGNGRSDETSTRPTTGTSSPT